MTKLEAYIMKFLYYYRKAKEYYNRVILDWLAMVGCFCLGIVALYYEYVLHIYFWGKELSIFFYFMWNTSIISEVKGE